MLVVDAAVTEAGPVGLEGAAAMPAERGSTGDAEAAMVMIEATTTATIVATRGVQVLLAAGVVAAAAMMVAAVAMRVPSVAVAAAVGVAAVDGARMAATSRAARSRPTPQHPKLMTERLPQRTPTRTAKHTGATPIERSSDRMSTTRRVNAP